LTGGIVRRFALAASHFALVVVVAVLFNFFVEALIPRAVPDPRPLPYQLTLYIDSLTDERAMRIIGNALPWTLGLLIPAMLIAFVIGTPLGALLGRSGNSGRSTLVSTPVIVLASVPAFLLGMVLTALFAVQLGWFPGAGAFSPTLIFERDRLATGMDLVIHAILPIATIALGGIGLFAVAMRGTVTMVVADDHVLFADALGLSQRRLFWAHLVRPSLLPQITGFALLLSIVVAGTVLVEANFSYPGLGYILYRAILGGDLSVMRGVTFVLIVGLAFSMAVVELAYPWLDPRIGRPGKA
jgi:peptide/nickel transport system permease protein